MKSSIWNHEINISNKHSKSRLTIFFLHYSRSNTKTIYLYQITKIKP